MSGLIALAEKQDKELVELVVGGSQQAYGELYARYRERMIYFCKHYMIGEEDAEDIVQDVFLQLWEKRHFLGSVTSFSGYVQAMTKNCVLKTLRHLDVHARFAQHILMNNHDYTNETEDTIIDNDYEKLLNEMIERLPPKQKEIFKLSHMEGLEYKEIAELLQTSVENVRKNASLALKKIQDQLSHHTDIRLLGTRTSRPHL